MSSSLPKGGQSATFIELIHKVKKSPNDIKSKKQRESSQNYRPGGTISQTTGRLRAQPRPRFLQWFKTFTVVFGTHGDPQTHQHTIRQTNKSGLSMMMQRRGLDKNDVLRHLRIPAFKQHH